LDVQDYLVHKDYCKGQKRRDSLGCQLMLPHNEEPMLRNVSKTYFVAGHVYCVETITLPCGVVIT
jgi:hypothetical protein